MILKVETKHDLKRFIYYVKDLYKDNPHYIYPLFYILFKELKKEVLKDQTYTAILSLNENSNVQGRLLYTMEYNEKEKRYSCYYSYFDTIDSQEVCDELFGYMEADMRKNNVFHSEGSFTPYDPDNRRGILVDGFDSDPVIFTSYNMDYYQKLIEANGYSKKVDTYSIIPVRTEKNIKRLNTLSSFFERRYNVDIDFIDFKNLDRDISDIHTILTEADNEIIYQEAPSIDLIKDVAENLKLFLDRRIAIIARERENRRPIGFAFCLLDFNQVFKKTKGRIFPIRFLLYKRKITKARGMMQYVVPKYQGTGLLGFMYKIIYEQFEILGINKFEAGTMMEGNTKALNTFSKFGGKIAKTYRIYGKDLTK
ncbi:hypothetical protein RJI07_08375 [Mycoplasmatota bacterium WC30]